MAKTARDGYHIGTLLQLETETKARLRPFLDRHNISLSEKMDLGTVPEIVSGYQGSDWQTFTASIIPVVENFLARFREIEQAGPEEDREILYSMVVHESAILKWEEMETRGDANGSLDDMIGQLQYPLSRPVGI